MATHLELNLERKKGRRCRRKNVPVRPTDEQLEELHRRKVNFGYKSLSQFLIERGLRDGGMIMSVDRERIERLLFEIRKVGRNINQMARSINSGSSIYSQKEIDTTMTEITRLVGAVGEAIAE